MFFVVLVLRFRFSCLVIYLDKLQCFFQVGGSKRSSAKMALTVYIIMHLCSSMFSPFCACVLAFVCVYVRGWGEGVRRH